MSIRIDKNKWNVLEKEIRCINLSNLEMIGIGLYLFIFLQSTELCPARNSRFLNLQLI